MVFIVNHSNLTCHRERREGGFPLLLPIAAGGEKLVCEGGRGGKGGREVGEGREEREEG